MNFKTKTYPQLIPDMKEWPIYKLSKDREKFIEEIIEFTMERLMSNPKLSDTIAKTIYLERIRIKEEPWKVDPPNEQLFWKKIRKKLITKSLDKEESEALIQNKEILYKIVKRYAVEIVGTFKPKTFQFARKFLTMFFSRLLNTAAGRNFQRIYSSKYRLYERFKIRGYVEEIRALMKIGTVVVVPTHSSNLDSLLVGYVMDVVLGLPFFSYGAGLNLYNTGYTAYFMNRLGAYRIDRRKKNPIYLETLKAMVNLSIQRGTNSLFFPGGTRSRNGSIENKLKKGILGTVIQSQRSLLQQGKSDKLFVVPVIIGYNTVLEAPFLIENYLKRTGKESYLRSKDVTHSLRKVLKFAWGFFSKSSEITLSFGQPMDVLGNKVDREGVSKDQNGNALLIKDYFISNGVITKDLQRENEYTNILADRIVERYYKDNTILCSYIVAFAAFKILIYQNPNLDLYGLLRLPTDDYEFPLDILENVVGQIQAELIDRAAKGEVQLDDRAKKDVKEVVKKGVMKMGNYHARRPLQFNKAGQLISEDFKVLYFYHNRLDHYDLDKVIKWKKLENKKVLI